VWAGAILERAGAVLYERARPAVAAIMSVAAGRAAPWRNDLVRRIVDGKQLVVGWRTWFSPERVEIHWQDVLLDLPDTAWLLDDGGIGHGLHAPITSLVHGQPQMFAAAWDYLDARALVPAGPRGTTRPVQRDAQPAAPIVTPVTPGMQLDKLTREYPDARQRGLPAAGPVRNR
jgi:hypothetical protein